MAAPDSIIILGGHIQLEHAKFWVSVLGFAGTTAALTFAAWQYRRAEKWRRAEFVAKEIKEFESSPGVRNVMSMIDWTKRRINLSQDPSLAAAGWPEIDRAILWRALLPHPIKGGDPAWLDTAATTTLVDGENERARFSSQEAAIRDTFDGFLDYLERFGNFIASSLVTSKEFKAYLGYWIDDLATDQGDSDDAKWRCVVLTYVHFYKFSGVQLLFREFGHDIEPDGTLFKALGARMRDPKLFEMLGAEVRRGDYADTVSSTAPS